MADDDLNRNPFTFITEAAAIPAPSSFFADFDLAWLLNNSVRAYGPPEPVEVIEPLPEPEGLDPLARRLWDALSDIAKADPVDDCYECQGDAWAVAIAREALGTRTEWRPGTQNLWYCPPKPKDPT